MRLGVLDVGSNTVHLLVVDAHPGARPLPAHSHKAELRLAELIDGSGAIAAKGIARLVAVIKDVLQAAEDKGVEEVLPFATSAVREATNADAVLDAVREETGVELSVVTGDEEARLTFLAVRRWFGWSAGKLRVLDIGGGSLEIAQGLDEVPAAAASLPLGAGRLTAAWLPKPVPDPEDVRALRRHVRAEIARTVGDFARLGAPDHTVATSKTFKQLARITGNTKALTLDALHEWVPKLAAMTPAQRAELPGVSASRAPQLLAGALVAEAALELFESAEAELCPWALREGVILRRLDHLPTV
ncbi:Ppx/GppA family phosphatase [Streptomyces sp. NPDC052396]|uniref:Ppx/GppA phosphatase family protein n=1 Tax=Streptomyces sp. NPDC052396 TaxID=3365689 RepID=UPI0037D412C9